MQVFFLVSTPPGFGGGTKFSIWNSFFGLLETINKLKVAKRKQKKQDKAKEEETHITHIDNFFALFLPVDEAVGKTIAQAARLNRPHTNGVKR